MYKDNIESIEERIAELQSDIEEGWLDPEYEQDIIDWKIELHTLKERLAREKGKTDFCDDMTVETIDDAIYSYFYEGRLDNDTIKCPLQIKQKLIRGEIECQAALLKIAKCVELAKQYKRGYITIKEYFDTCEIYYI